MGSFEETATEATSRERENTQAVTELHP